MKKKKDTFALFVDALTLSRKASKMESKDIFANHVRTSLEVNGELKLFLPNNSGVIMLFINKQSENCRNAMV